MRKKLNMCRKILMISAAVFLPAFFCLSAEAEETEEEKYRVYFVDADDYDRKIFNFQEGGVPEGAPLIVTYPNQIVGSDGHLWKAVTESPQSFTVYQSGTHKYYIEYRQGEKVSELEDPEADGRKKLEFWLEKAWQADCEITGQNPEGNKGELAVGSDSENNSRIKGLVSAINDAQWHYFYMIGENYTPQTLVIGTSLDAEYSSVTQETFKVGKEKYQVLRVGVCRHFTPENCVHEWEGVTSAPNGCLTAGQETFRCRKCHTEETVLLPALGHAEENGDSLCDRCGRRVSAQTVGDKIQTTLKTSGGETALTFTCLDDDYNGSGRQLYLADNILDREMTGVCFTDSEFNTSPLRDYLNLSFANNSSIASALQPIERPDAAGSVDYASIFSKEEYEAYQDVAEAAGAGWFLRTAAPGTDEIYAVGEDGAVRTVSVSGSNLYGTRPFILLEKPETGETAEPARWETGDIQMRRIGGKTYRFRCVDDDYSDNQDGHRKAALFLCDSVIRSDIDSGQTVLKTFSFGTDNNYKTSKVRKWLQENSADSSFNLEPIFIGVNTAYTGSTEAGAWEQLAEKRLISHGIGFQLMQDKLFCLSVEEASKYRDELWKFGSGENNPQTQVSAYSQGYYLRTPFYAVNDGEKFLYTDDIYVVDLVKGNIHTAKTDSETYGIRPAFTLPQE